MNLLPTNLSKESIFILIAYNISFQILKWYATKTKEFLLGNAKFSYRVEAVYVLQN